MITGALSFRTQAAVNFSNDAVQTALAGLLQGAAWNENRYSNALVILDTATDQADYDAGKQIISTYLLKNKSSLSGISERKSATAKIEADIKNVRAAFAGLGKSAPINIFLEASGKGGAAPAFDPKGYGEYVMSKIKKDGKMLEGKALNEALLGLFKELFAADKPKDEKASNAGHALLAVIANESKDLPGAITGLTAK